MRSLLQLVASTTNIALVRILETRSLCALSPATLKNCELSESKENHGLEVVHEGSKVEAEGCQCFRNPGGGASAFAGGHLEVTSCETQSQLESSRVLGTDAWKT